MPTPWRSTRTESAEQLRGASEVRAKSCQVHLRLDAHLTVAAPGMWTDRLVSGAAPAPRTAASEA